MSTIEECTIEELERQIQIKTDFLEICQEQAFRARMDLFILRLRLKEQKILDVAK